MTLWLDATERVPPGEANDFWRVTLCRDRDGRDGARPSSLGEQALAGHAPS
ncbi:MAG: hypothetical protein NZ741_07290 [Armatimonadetes bacterium]|nr:hypothetical protein [Armatimonadota bacterium]